MLEKLRELYHNLWNIKLKNLTSKKSFVVQQIRILVLAFRGFVEDKIQLRASALTFYSLLSIVPVMALGFAIAKGFGYDEVLKENLQKNFGGQETVLNKIIEFAEDLLNNTKEGYLAGVGAILLIWSVMKVLGHIESSFNDIWQIKKSRNFFRKFSDYLSLMLVVPLLMVVASTYTIKMANSVQELEYIGWFSIFIAKLGPLFIMWIVFSMIYIVMPNTKVNFKYGIIAGFVASLAFSVLQSLLVNFIFDMFSDKYYAIYGAFAVLPIFLFWLQWSWLIVLFGAELSFAYQNVENYEFETESLKISNFYKRILSFLIMHSIVNNYKTGDKALTSSDISHNLDIPISLVREIIFNLKSCGLIIETTTYFEKEMAYIPALDINMIDIKFVQEKLEKHGSDNITIVETPTFKKIKDIQSDILDNIAKSKHNTLIKDL